MAIVHDEQGYASNGKANAALTTGIIGTSGFGLALLNGLGGVLGMGKPMCNEDHFVNRYEATQAARIAELETEVKLRDSNIYTDQKILDLSEYLFAAVAFGDIHAVEFFEPCAKGSVWL